MGGPHCKISGSLSMHYLTPGSRAPLELRDTDAPIMIVKENWRM